jgi:cytochrome b561
MPTARVQFAAFSRLLHWAMAVMVLTMLCIGVAMVVSLADYHALVSIHRPLGIAILILVVVRFVNRRLNPPPPFPDTMSRLERRAATASELTMYGLMFVLPLVGWGMLSAARTGFRSTPCRCRSTVSMGPIAASSSRCCPSSSGVASPRSG